MHTFQVYHDSFRTYRFSPAEDSFDSPSDTPSNACYCRREPCLQSGLFDISTCEPGSPIVISWPHFLYAEPNLRRAVQGMNPDPLLHRFHIDVQPVRKKSVC